MAKLCSISDQKWKIYYQQSKKKSNWMVEFTPSPAHLSRHFESISQHFRRFPSRSWQFLAYPIGSIDILDLLWQVLSKKETREFLRFWAQPLILFVQVGSDQPLSSTLIQIRIGDIGHEQLKQYYSTETWHTHQFHYISFADKRVSATAVKVWLLVEAQFNFLTKSPGLPWCQQDWHCS